MEYTVRNEENYTTIIRENADSSSTIIPTDESNSDYQAYLRWLNGEDEAQSL